MPRHRHADLMIAYANDTSLEIECRPIGEWDWGKSALCKSWDPEFEYRIKPKPPVTKYRFAYRAANSNQPALYISNDSYRTAEDLENHFKRNRVEKMIVCDRLDSTAKEFFES